MKEESIVSMIESFIEDCFNERTPSKKAIIEGVRYILAGRSKSIESEKAKDERIKELEEGLQLLLKSENREHMISIASATLNGELAQQLLNK